MTESPNYTQCPKCGNNRHKIVSQKETLETVLVQCRGCGEIGCCIETFRKGLFSGWESKEIKQVCFNCQCTSKEKMNFNRLGFVSPSRSELERQNPDVDLDRFLKQF